MPHNNWKDTQIFTQLKSKKESKDLFAENMITLLETPSVMKAIEDILN